MQSHYKMHFDTEKSGLKIRVLFTLLYWSLTFCDRNILLEMPAIASVTVNIVVFAISNFREGIPT